MLSPKKELDELWYKITNGESNVKSAIDRKGYPMKYKYLDDKKTRLQYRTHSSDLSNNEPTIDIHNKLDNRKIHIDIHQNKGMK